MRGIDQVKLKTCIQQRLPLTIAGTQMSHADRLDMTAKLSVIGTENQRQSRMSGGKCHLQSVQLAGFVPYSHHTINMDEDGGRIERADDVEQVPLASTAEASVVPDRSHKWFP